MADTAIVNQRGSDGGLGYCHGSDFEPALLEADELADYIIKFAATGDPNGASNRTIVWPQYDKKERKVLSILDGDVPLAIGNDSLRLEPMATLTALSLEYPL